MSGIYSHAVAIGACKVNPISDCKILGDIIAPGDTAHYTLEEAENIMSALVDHVDAQLIFALSYFAGLRPGEINALDWTDFDTEFVHVRRAIGRGVVATPKTKKSIRSVPLIAPVRIAAGSCGARSAATRRAVGYSRTATVEPINLTKFVERVIEPALEAKGVRVQDAVRWTARLRYHPQGTHRSVCGRSGRARTRQHSHD